MEAQTSRPWYLKLHWQVLIAMALGLATGWLWGKDAATAVGWMGTLFIRALKMIIIPLVITSIVSGVASVGGGRSLGRLFSKTLGYYVLSSFLAIMAGLVAVNLIQPGASFPSELVQQTEELELDTIESPVDLLLNIVPTNVVEAAASSDMLGVIFFSIVFGIALSGMPDGPRQKLTELFEAGFKVMMRLTSGIIKLLPLGVFGLMVNAIAAFGFKSFNAVGAYFATITVSLGFHFFITLPLLLLLLGKMSPAIHYRNMLDAILTAFSTSSSAATLPVTMRSVEDRVKVSNKVSSFVLPMGATVNMDGTALYECAGVLFIAQALGAELTLLQQGLVVLTALLASIGAAAVPSAGLVVIFIVLEAVELRGEAVNAIVGLMLAVDRPLDMARTAVNITSDSCGAAIIARSEGETEVNAEVTPV